MGLHCVLLCFILQVLWCVFSEAETWHVSIPTELMVLSGSCADIPCSFTRPDSHSPSETAWYSYSRTQYPLVYSRSTQDVVETFRGRTRLSGDVRNGSCSLRITDVSPAMNDYQIYPWIDPDHVKHTFYHQTVKLNVKATAPPVQLSVEGSPVEGGTIRITCAVVHTCPSSPPTLMFGGISGDVQINQTDLGSGSWRTQSSISFTARISDHGREVGCWVQHSGRRAAPSWIDINVNYSPRSVHVSGESSKAVEGGNVILECRSDANPPASEFLWFLQRTDSLITLTGRDQSITVTDLQPDQNSFYCTAHSALGVSNSSSPFIISVEYEPSISPESSCIIRGRVLWCWCKVRSLPNASVTWKIEGALPTFSLRDMEEFSFLQNHTLRGKLQINKFILHLSVTCTASNDHGQQEHNLIMKASPQNVSITLQPARVLEGQDLTLSCSSHSSPAVLSYSWSRLEGGRVIQLREQSENLHLQVTGHRMGPFRCSAFNEIGEGSSDSTSVHVDSAPVISQNSTCRLDDGVVWCECVVEGYPVPSVTWTASSVEASHIVSVDPYGPLRATLTGPIRSQEIRLITCHATNEHGRISLQLPLKDSSSTSSSSLVAAGCGATALALIIAAVLYWIQKRRSNDSQDNVVVEVEMNINNQRKTGARTTRLR